MAADDKKRYYWLKLHKDFFKRHEIKIVEDMPNGKEYILFYLKLLVESVTHEGKLRFSDTIPYNVQMLASLTNTNIDIVKSAMQIFVELKMIEVLDDETIYMTEVEQLIGSETGAAARKREQRAIGTDVGQLGDIVPKRLDIRDKSIENKDNIAKRKPQKHKYGQYQHVLLTDEQLLKLKAEYPNYLDLITYLDEYIEMKGYKAKNHYLAIKKWVVDAVSREKNKMPDFTLKKKERKLSAEDEEILRRLREG